MKKLILPILLVTTSALSAQILDIKFNNPKTLTITEAETVIADSLIVNYYIDNGRDKKLTVNITFFLANTPTNKKQDLIVWEGAAYTTNQGYSKAQLKQRIKDILNP